MRGLRSTCCGAELVASLADGVLVGSCGECCTNMVRVNPKTGVEEWLDGASPWTTKQLVPVVHVRPRKVEMREMDGAEIGCCRPREKDDGPAQTCVRCGESEETGENARFARLYDEVVCYSCFDAWLRSNYVFGRFVVFLRELSDVWVAAVAFVELMLQTAASEQVELAFQRKKQEMLASLQAEIDRIVAEMRGMGLPVVECTITAVDGEPVEVPKGSVLVVE